MATLILRDIWKRFNQVPALQGLNFECRDGEFFCLLGPSGAGKSTTIKVIAGLETPQQGEVFLADKPITRLFPQERNVATAFESYALYPHLTVFENLAFPLKAPLRAAQYSPAEREKRVKEIVELLNIAELLARYPRQLSGGQRQRVALGRALIRQPQLYLLDEPIAHLDAKLRHRMRSELRKIQTESGITTLYATPDQLEALSMADTIAVINQGKIEQIGSPDDIYARPINLFVAHFVGDPPMNILDADFAGVSLAVRTEETFHLPVPPEPRPLLAEKVGQAPLKVGIRPKDIHLTSVTAVTAALRGEVKSLDTLGQTTIVSIKVGQIELKVKIATAEAPERGSQVGLKLDNSKFHYFDPRTHLRIG